MNRLLHRLDPVHPRFPHPDSALDHPNGLLAVGGNLEPETLLEAYRQGIFPWYEEGQPLLWWSPDPRAVIAPDKIHVSRSLRRLLQKHVYHVTSDVAFQQVITSCARIPRKGEGTWITDAMLSAYTRLHEMGYVHSVESWREDKLVGGLYGVTIGSVFCGESMFSAETGASKVALVSLANTLFNQGFKLIDCQLPNAHLTSMGAESIPRAEFLAKLLVMAREQPDWPNSWGFAKV